MLLSMACTLIPRKKQGYLIRSSDTLDCGDVIKEVVFKKGNLRQDCREYEIGFTPHRATLLTLIHSYESCCPYSTASLCARPSISMNLCLEIFAILTVNTNHGKWLIVRKFCLNIGRS